MSTALENCLGKPASELLAQEPYSLWDSKRSLTRDISKKPIVHYEFPKRGFELRCDSEDNVATIFITLSKGYDPTPARPSISPSHGPVPKSANVSGLQREAEKAMDVTVLGIAS